MKKKRTCQVYEPDVQQDWVPAPEEEPGAPSGSRSGGVVVSAVMACQATPKALKVAEKTGDDMDRIQNAEESGVTPAGELYTQEDARNDRIRSTPTPGSSMSSCMPPPFCWARHPSPAFSPVTKF